MSAGVLDPVVAVVDISVDCPVCGVPLAHHRVTRWYGRRYDVWSDPMAARGETCFVVTLRPYPNEPRPARPHRPARRPRKGER